MFYSSHKAQSLQSATNLYTEFLELSTKHSSPTPTKVLRKIGDWHKHSDSKRTKCRKYNCLIEGGRAEEGDLILFIDKDIINYKTPPAKKKGEIWAFSSKEPQSHLDTEVASNWNGMFNYSSTYLRESVGSKYNFRRSIIRKKVPTNTSFAVKREKIGLHSRALWFVSHCTQDNRFPVLSARAEYVKDLAKHFPIDVYTRHDACKQQLQGLVKSDNNQEPSLGQYSFYLAFENNLCKDYISEKFWKVLKEDVLTIPIVLGGTSIKEYEYIAPPHSFIHVKNFSSPLDLANHLRFVLSNDEAFNYYHEWRNNFVTYRQSELSRWLIKWLLTY